MVDDVGADFTERPSARDPMTLSGEFLVVNCGSSSIKLGVFAAGAVRRVWSAGVERIGQAEAHFQVSDGGRLPVGVSRPVADHDAALRMLFDAVAQRASGSALSAVGHRVVHGGLEFDGPQLLDAGAEEKLRGLVPLAPLHMPRNLAGIAAARRACPNLPQVACFDTTFHRTLPRRAAMLALPRKLFDSGVRRYGFHGLSFEYIVEALRGTGVDVARERIVIAHLGAGASMCALREGRSIETTMGFSTLTGLPMSTRCGDADPGAVLHLLTARGLSAEQLQRMLYLESGLLGVSGVSGDMQVLLARAHEPGPAEAIDLFCYQARRQIASLAAVLGGLDRLVFTGGIGANAADVRAQICAELGFLGVALDESRNLGMARLISTNASSVAVEALETDEEVVIARHVRRALESLTL